MPPKHLKERGHACIFTRLAEATDRPIVIYNIPYRTGVNLGNDTLLELAELPNIVAVKDSSGNLAQSLDLLSRRPNGFAVMTARTAPSTRCSPTVPTAASWPRPISPSNSS